MRWRTRIWMPHLTTLVMYDRFVDIFDLHVLSFTLPSSLYLLFFSMHIIGNRSRLI